MATALDTYKYHYGMRDKPDGAVVLKHARNHGFTDNLAFKSISPQALEEIGIHAFMTREEIIGTLDEESEKEIPAISRSAIKSILDFCKLKIYQAEEETRDESDNRKKRLTNKYNEIHYKFFSRIIDPFFDAVFRKMYTGSFFKKNEKK